MSDQAWPAGSTEVDPVVVEVVRSGLVESVHRGRFVITAPDGEVLEAAGEVNAAFYPRSAVKPLQAVAMLRLGLDLPSEQLAIACASHAGEPFQLELVQRILRDHGLTETDLQTPPARPSDERAREAEIVAGQLRRPLAMNCSGKHAAMLATAVINGWSTDDYRSPEHPVQKGILATIAELTGDHGAPVAVDGCGAVLTTLTLTGLARGFGRIAVAGGSDGSAGVGSQAAAEARVAAAIRRHPTAVSGTRRDESALLTALPGLIAKAGAEGVYAVGLPDGRAVALKIIDGADRARSVLMAELLLGLGLDHETVRAQARPPVLGHVEPVGELRALVSR